MALERGFRRLTIAISILILSLGFSVNIIAFRSYAPGATVQVTLEDGGEVLLDGPEDYLGNRNVLEELLARHELRPIRVRQDPTYGRVEELARIIDVQVIRRPLYWWWTQTWLVRAASILVVLIWSGFFAVRWIADGFTSA